MKINPPHKSIKRRVFRWIFTLLLTLLAGLAHAKVATTSSGGKNYVSINNIAAYYGMKTSSSSERIFIKSQWNTLEFEPGRRRCWVNGILLWLNEPIQKIKSQWTISDKDFENIIDPATRPHSCLAKQNRKVIVLDPGHGGKDTGALSARNIQEKLLTMNIARRVKKILQANGLTVLLTRDGDQTLTLSQRTQKAKSWGADLFVSLHADSAGSSAEGIGTFILARPGCYSTHNYGQGTPSTTYNVGNKYDQANTILAYRIQQNLVKATGQPDRGVKHARLHVLRNAPCPATLIEMGFLSNAKEEALFLKSAHQTKMAKGIASGILAYLNDVKRAKSSR